ncbi:DUF6910 family protein [Nocardioides zhouii]|uniref:Uncharacterized protein n=1 Tax=Nocardioides zhouii TaxID=1168729 RepID=A0A4Q2T9Q8_9ACTN|nr:hypothetical protein [Nocardioides zhouii]RYC14741.1 hypothetical protein EUA94_01060 [Nocardioides zhouii]
MDVEVLGAQRLRFADGSPVRAASAVVPFGDGHLVVSDDTTHAAWFRPGTAATRVRLLPPVDGHELFDEESGTKHLKPDLETACRVSVDGAPAVLVMGSGSSPRRMRWCLLRLDGGKAEVVVADMAEVYASVAAALGIDPDQLNLEGACVVGGSLRWFHRGLPAAGLPSASIDLDVEAAVAAARGGEAADLRVTRPVHYDLGSVAGVGLAVTDVVALPDGDILACAAAEDSPNPRDDGPVTATALARIRGDRVVEVVPLPTLDGAVLKVEGLMVLDHDDRATTLFVVIDVDDPEAASWSATLHVRL